MPADQPLRIRGSERQGAAPPVREVRVERARRLTPGATREGGAGAGVGGGSVEVAPDEVVRLTLDNGFALWSRADDLVRERGRRDAARGGDAAWEIEVRPSARGGGGTRGLLRLGIRALELFGIDLKGRTAAELADRWELGRLDDRPPGLYRCDLGEAPTLTEVAPGETLPADRGPLLIFVHGTGSSCRGSFGGLWGGAGGSDAAPAGDATAKGAAALRETLRERYGDRVFAWEHRTLTQSPIANALGLAERLPAGAELHLVTHSRGGLVGELLCLGERDRGADPLGSGLAETLFAADRTIADQLGLSPLSPAAAAKRDLGYAADREALARLLALLDGRGLRIRRFVRVACPARGTTLASGRLDRWLSVLGYLAPPGLAGDLLDFVLAVVKERTDPRVLPGLEAMLPGSALTRLLHRPDLATASDLAVIAGDTEGDSLWGQIKLLAADWFFGSDHDLVVNVGSMAGGIRRPPGGARYLCDRGPEVNHFGYFRNERSRRWLVAGLTRPDGADGGFAPLGEAPAEPPRWRAAVARARAGGGARPLAVVVPGAMGSALRAHGLDLWLDYRALLRGGLSRLGMGEPRVEATALLDRFYAPLLEFLARTHRIETFPYDWRLSVRDAAARLAAALGDWLREPERTRSPVHLVAHSMGGLVVRAMIADGGAGAAVWRRICALPESRLLMLGTPNLGSFEAVRWLTGANPTLARLTLLDLTRGSDGMVDLVRAFPGLLELLPWGPQDPDFTRADLWQGLKSALRASWPTADAARLRQVRDTWALLRASPVDPARMVYVAGQQDATVCGYRLDPEEESHLAGRQRLVFRATREGDGTVPWQSGLLPGLPVWYLRDTAHGALCTQRRAFPGYLDLLTTGKTTRLDTVPPGRGRAAASGAGEGEPFDLPAAPPADDLPDAATVDALGFGPGGAGDGGAESGGGPSLRVSVRYGHLAYARHPVLVGHYQDDTIVNAEAALDERLDGALTRHMQLGLYPGPLASHALFVNERPQGKPLGAVVIGLGQVGGLSPPLLETGVRDALLDYALRILQWPDARFGDPGSVRSAALSCLLIGSGAGGVGLADSVGSILRGAVAAADRLRETGLDERVAIDRIELVEVYQDVAIAAAEALERVLEDAQLAGRAIWEPRAIDRGEGGLRRVRCEDAQGWWQRLEILEDRGRDALRFIASTDRARAEVTLATGQLRLADGFIAQASRSSAANAEVSKTLFEMLLPNRLRDLSPRQSDLVLLVDELSARFPWELLEDRWSQSGRPPAVSAGLIRQLKTAELRERPAHASAPTAFVVGNPDLDGWGDFPDLPGAREEAVQVSALLRERGFDVTDAIDERADGILNGLHRDAWRILHLAGHGEHAYAVPQAALPGACPACGQTPAPVATRLSGMVIGRDTFLTPGDVQQMRWVPELVFINCCHLGKTLRADAPPYHRLAANLAVQFIRMGVKAVVAAGWAVDDRAAHAFADAFYGAMLAGRQFGEAVRIARDACWTRYPEANTWGAYQCYGDPGFRLRAEGSAPLRPPPAPYRDPAELVADLENLAEEIRMDRGERGEDPETLTALRERIDARVAAVPADRREDWLGRADVAAALGFAWGETRAYAESADWLDRALRSTAGDCPVRALERHHDYRLRHLGEQWQTLRDEPRGPAWEDRRQGLVEAIDASVGELAQVCRRSPTAERLALLGAACMRLAWLETDPQGRLEALVNMEAYYRRALEIGPTPGADRRPERVPGSVPGPMSGPMPGPISGPMPDASPDSPGVPTGAPDPGRFPHWAIARLLAARLDPVRGGDWQGALPEQCRGMADLARARDAQAPSFRNAVAVADNELVGLLAAAQVGSRPKGESAERIAGLYRDAFDRGASPQEVGWVGDRLDFLVALADELPAAVRPVLVRIRESLP